MGQGPASFLPLITPRRKSSRSRLWVKMEAGLSGSCGNSPPEQPQQGCYFWQLLQPGFAQKRSEQEQLSAAVRAAAPPASAFVSVPVSHLLRAWVGRKPRLGPSLCEGKEGGREGAAVQINGKQRARELWGQPQKQPHAVPSPLCTRRPEGQGQRLVTPTLGHSSWFFFSPSEHRGENSPPSGRCRNTSWIGVFGVAAKLQRPPWAASRLLSGPAARGRR